jgi:hypothetical protein
LAGFHPLLHIDTSFGEPLEMVFPQLGVDEMESLIPLVEAVFDERAKDPVLLVDAVEESADVTVPAEHTSGKLHGAVGGYHKLPLRQ